MKRHAVLLALALPISLLACAAQATGAASAPQAKPAAVACPAASAVQRLGAASSKGRHVPDENDACADSRGAVKPAHPAASSTAP